MKFINQVQTDYQQKLVSMYGFFPSSRQQVQTRLAEAQSGHLLEALLGVAAPVASDKPVKDRVLAARLMLVT